MECSICGWNEVCCDSCHSKIGLTEWIKCSERLPSNTLDVLVINEDGKMSVSCFFKCVSYNEYIWENRDDQNITGLITHWMPLPKPPNE